MKNGAIRAFALVLIVAVAVFFGLIIGREIYFETGYNAGYEASDEANRKKYSDEANIYSEYCEWELIGETTRNSEEEHRVSITFEVDRGNHAASTWYAVKRVRYSGGAGVYEVTFTSGAIGYFPVNTVEVRVK